MLLLVTIVLVVVAAITLLIGILGDSLAFIFISIGSSAVAAIVLALLSQSNRKRVQEAPTAGASPLETATAAIPPVALAEPVPAARAGRGLPIRGYDTLRVNEILPALESLDLDQLEEVAQHEETNKNRTTVLNRIDELMDELEAEEAGAGVGAKAAAAIEDIGEPTIATAAEVADGFPIPDYDSLSEAQVIALLEDLDADELETVADREEAGPNRDAVLDAIDDRLDILEGIVAPPPAAKKKAAVAKRPAPSRAAAAPAKKKAAASRTPAKKATARRATATRAPAKKATARKAASAPVKKAAASRKAAPVKKAAAKKAPAKKAPAKKAPAKKTTAKKAAKRR